MPDSVDVAKMKVADLKRELKIRGLSITGNKNELSERLQAALIDGELSLDDTAISGEDLLDEDGVLTDEEEKILNENELLESPTREKQDLSDLLQEKNSTQANNAAASTKKVVLKRKISTNILSELGTSISAEVEETLLAPSKLIKKVESTAETTTTEKPTAGAKKMTILTAQERLEMRAKKFGLNTVAAAATVTESKPTEITSSAKDAPVVNSEAEASILKKRAERFGCVVSSKMVQLDVQDRLQKRKERFGGGGGGGAGAATAATQSKPAEANSATTTTTDVWAEKARLRLERFKSSDKKTINA